MKTFDISSICKCCCCERQEVLHPQAAVVRLNGDPVSLGTEADGVRFDFYAVLLIEQGCEATEDCGHRFYDYSAATMAFLRPGELLQLSRSGGLLERGWILAFHPDLLHRTSLGSHIGEYTYFGYDKRESLHLSDAERSKVNCCLANIEDELHHAVDGHTATILARHIQLMLDYCSRFYERQFITRERSSTMLLSRLEDMVNAHLLSPAMQSGLLPSASDMAARLGLSEAYFSDFLLHATGLPFADFVQLRRLALAKRMLTAANGTPCFVARALGFGGVQRFSVVFKRTTGVAPRVWRQQRLGGGKH